MSKNITKTIIDRDYSSVPSNHIKFIEECPSFLCQYIDPSKVIEAVKGINEIVSPLANPPSSVYSYFYSFANALSLGVLNLFTSNRLEKCSPKLDKFIQEQNETVFNPCGISIINPRHKAMLQIEFEIENSSKMN